MVAMRIYTVKEALAVLKIGRWRLDQFIDEQRLKPVRLRPMLFNARHVDEFATIPRPPGRPRKER